MILQPLAHGLKCAILLDSVTETHYIVYTMEGHKRTKSSRTKSSPSIVHFYLDRLTKQVILYLWGDSLSGKALVKISV